MATADTYTSADIEWPCLSKGFEYILEVCKAINFNPTAYLNKNSHDLFQSNLSIKQVSFKLFKFMLQEGIIPLVKWVNISKKLIIFALWYANLLVRMQKYTVLVLNGWCQICKKSLYSMSCVNPERFALSYKVDLTKSHLYEQCWNDFYPNKVTVNQILCSPF